jgi:hypothetical protein
MRIDTESDRWDPPVSAKLVLYVLTWTGTHLPATPTAGTHLPATPTAGTPPPATTYRAAGPPRPKLASSCPPALAAPRPHRAIPHLPSHGRCPAPSPRRPELVAPCLLDIAARSSSPRAAPSSSPAVQELGRGGDPPKMGQGEEIRWRWTRGGDPPEMGQGEDSRRPAGVLGGRGAVASHRKKKTTPAFFYWADKWAPVQLSTNRIFFVSSASHLSNLVSIRVQLAISVNWKKVVVFCD